MLKRFFYKRESIIKTWLISYIFVLIIPIIISGITYSVTSNILENEINNSNSLSLKRIQQQIDGIIADGERLSIELALNSRISSFLKQYGSMEDISGYEIYQAIIDLATYRMPNKTIEDFYIYFKNLDMVLSNYTCKDSRNFYEVYIREKG